jgi:penicillin-insensitive murein DD-endopeptidase
MSPTMRARAAAFALLAALSLTAGAAASPWSEVPGPSAGPPHVIGEAARGCLAGATMLPTEGPGFQVIHLSRRRNFSHPQTVDFVERLGRAAAASGLAPFYVGDMSLPRGGPMPNGHASHQSGVDVDIWFNLDPKPDLAPAAREDVPLPTMVNAAQTAIDPAQFGRRQVMLLRLAASDPSVDRIFVNRAIKRALCEGVGGANASDRSWQHRIRAWYGHDEHFHVRLTCPAGSPDCVRQAPVPAGDGCDASLDWWFQPHPPATPGPPKPRPALPAQCQAVLDSP